jgi:eukaryotic-like serine/threonine-protein kinase
VRLSNGTRLGAYEIVAPLGAGGMGEVYRARDSRLGRTVAIKILPAELSRDETRRSRFQREAKAISALSHQNICTLHDIGSENGIDYLVLEYLEGETLADRMRRGPLPLGEAVRYAIEIAAALETAHRNGIIHRDLKPANIMLTKSGVKLLDFGLAKPSLRTDLSTEATSPQQLTADGAAVGTLAFMAPEQIERGQADERSDIFAFGNILFRMVTGRSPFDGVGAIVRESPPPTNAPPALDRLVQTCLRKNPDERIQSAHDVKLQLEWIAESPATTPTASRPRRLPWIIAGLASLIAVAAILIAVTRHAATTPARIQQFAIELPPVANGNDWAYNDLAISPDATRIVISCDFGNGRQLYLRAVDKPELVALPGTAGALNPFFSPDSRWIGFAADGKLKKLQPGGGAPVTICDAPRSRGATWSADDTIVFAPMSSGTGLSIVSANGGAPRALTTLNASQQEWSHRWPSFLPDGQHALFAIDDWSADYTRKKIAVVDVASGRTRILLDAATNPRYVPPGYMIFARERTLYAIVFDAKTMQMSGLPVPILSNVMTHVGTGATQAAIANDGTLVYVPYVPATDERELVWVDRKGSTEPISNIRRPYFTPSISPDGKQLLVEVGEERAGDLWLLDMASNSWSRLASEGKSIFPMWSPDGHEILFAWNRFGRYRIFSMPPDGSTPPRQITVGENMPAPRSISSDGRQLLFEDQDPVTSLDVWSLKIGGDRTPVLRSTSDERDPDFSRDGQWFAYSSNESGRAEVYVQHFPPTGRKWAVSLDGGTFPRWSSAGNELFFRNHRQVLVARVNTRPTPSIAKPEVLFEGPFAAGYDVAPDGKRFVMLRENDRAQEVTLGVVLNWSADVARRPASRGQ